VIGKLSKRKSGPKFYLKQQKKEVAKKEALKSAQHKKRVRFADNLVQSPHRQRQHNLVSLVFGSFTAEVDPLQFNC
jgi:hypothetical protein